VSRDGPFTPLWTYDPDLKWRDGEAIDRLLRWPEVDRAVAAMPEGTKHVWVRYRMRGMGLDDIRLSTTESARGASPLEITHVWTQNGKRHEHTERMAAGLRAASYGISIPGAAPVRNEELILSCPR
jgi:hypothetical protein